MRIKKIKNQYNPEKIINNSNLKPNISQQGVKVNIKQVTLAALLTASINSAYASPWASVTIENKSNLTISMDLISRALFVATHSVNGSVTDNIEPQEFIFGKVTNKDSAKETISISLKFREDPRISAKSCIFETSNNTSINPDGSRSYNWTKNAIGTNGAICTATIVSTNPQTGEWETNFTMQ